MEPVAIRLKFKYRQRKTPKAIKHTKAGNGKRPGDAGRVSWRAGTGLGKK